MGIGHTVRSHPAPPPAPLFPEPVRRPLWSDLSSTAGRIAFQLRPRFSLDQALLLPPCMLEHSADANAVPERAYSFASVGILQSLPKLRLVLCGSPHAGCSSRHARVHCPHEAYRRPFAGR